MVYALFCAANVSPEAIHRILTEAREGATSNVFWLANLTWDPAADLKKEPAYSTIAIVQSSISSAFVGKDLATFGKLLQNAPERAKQHLDGELFAVLDAETNEDGSVLLCQMQLGQQNVKMLRALPRKAASVLASISS